MRDYFNKAEHEAGDLEFNYADIGDDEALKYFKAGTAEEKGFFILTSQLFEKIVKNSAKEDNLNVNKLDTNFIILRYKNGLNSHYRIIYSM